MKTLGQHESVSRTKEGKGQVIEADGDSASKAMNPRASTKENYLKHSIYLLRFIIIVQRFRFRLHRFASWVSSKQAKNRGMIRVNGRWVDQVTYNRLVQRKGNSST